MRAPHFRWLARLLAVALLTVFAASPVLAEDWDDDEETEEEYEDEEDLGALTMGDRQCYSGVTGATGWARDPSGGTSFGVGARMGCRWMGILALEAEVDWMDEFSGAQADRIIGIGVNGLLFLPLYDVVPEALERVQPYLLGGADYAYSRIGRSKNDPEGNPALSVGGGLRVYVTKALALDLRGKYVNHVGDTQLSYGEFDWGFSYDFYAF